MPTGGHVHVICMGGLIDFRHICNSDFQWIDVICRPISNIHIYTTLEQTSLYRTVTFIVCIILAKPLHNRDIVSVHFNNFYCKGICDKLSWHLFMLTYIYLNVDEC